MMLDVFGLRRMAAQRETDTAENWTRRVKEAAFADPAADVVGLAEVGPAFIFDRDWRRSPIREKYIIVIGGRMDYHSLRKPADTPPTVVLTKCFRPAVLTVMRTYVRTQAAAFVLADWIRVLGYHAHPRGGPKGSPVNLIHAAIAAGLGQLGKHGSMMSVEVGSNMRLSYMLTDLPLVPDTPRDIGVDEFCKSCRLCTDVCPPKAIRNEKQWVRGEFKWYVDFDKCMPYFNEHYGCALCLAVCPWSRPGMARKLVEKMARKKAAKATREAT